MNTEIMPDGSIKETYYDEAEYVIRGKELDRSVGRRQILYEGWLKGQLIRILRR